MVMVLSRGSPGTICQWWNTERQNAWPWVWVRKSVSKPKESMAGTKALMVYRGEPGAGADTSTKRYGSISLGVAIKNAEYATLLDVGII